MTNFEHPSKSGCKTALHSYFGFLKEVDIFKIPVTENLSFERHNYKTNKSKHNHQLGSYIGGLTSIVVMGFLVAYTIILIIQMHSGDIDQLKNTVMSNPLGEEGGQNDFDLKDFTFMPVIEINTYTPEAQHAHLGIYEGDPDDLVFNLTRFYDHVTFIALQRNRNVSISQYAYL